MEKLFLVIVVVALLTIGFGVGVLFERNNAPEKQYTIQPYTGIGSGVLAPGTVLKENYKAPDSIIGKVEGGVYILEEVK